MSPDEKNPLSTPETDALHARMLQKKLFVVMTRAVKPLDEVKKHIVAHLHHQIALEKAGILFGAGPVSGKDGKVEFGLIILRAKDFEEAEKIAASDPMHVAGVREYTLSQWSLNEGRIGVTLDFSDRSYRLD